MVERMPNQAEAMGLITLMHLHDARRNASTDLNGALIPLGEQDCSFWNRTSITAAVAPIDRTLLLRQAGRTKFKPQLRLQINAL